jgi:hypothetical protein
LGLLGLRAAQHGAHTACSAYGAKIRQKKSSLLV